MTSAPSSLSSKMADAIRFLSMDAVQAAKSGHPGMPMGMADVATVLFSSFIKLNPRDPQWPDRDRFVLSAGHGSMLHYAVNHLMGYADMTIDQLRNFRQMGAITAGHPNTAWPRVSKPRPARWVRGWRLLSVWPLPKG